MNKLEIINQVLKELRLQEIVSLSDASMLEFPYNLLEDFLDESIRKISNYRNYEWSVERVNLDYSLNENVFNLEDYKIDYKRIQTVYLHDGNQIYYTKGYDREFYKKLFINPVNGKPQIHTQKAYELEFYPVPDKDYHITIKHNRQIPLLVSDSSNIEYLPDREQQSIIYYICKMLGYILGLESAKIYEELEYKDLSKTMVKDKVYANASNMMRSNINWGG